MMHHRLHSPAPALASADNFMMPDSPSTWQILGPRIAGRRQHLDDFAGPDRRPGHSLAGERLDIPAGIADGQQAMAAETPATASERARAANSQRIQIGRHGRLGGDKNLPHQMDGPAGATASRRIKRRRQMPSRIGHANEAHVPIFPHVHVDRPGANFVRACLARPGNAHPRRRRDVPFRPRLAGEQCAADPIAGKNNAGANGGGEIGALQLQGTKRIPRRHRQQHCRKPGQEYASAALRLKHDGRIQILARDGDLARDGQFKRSAPDVPNDRIDRLGTSEVRVNSDFPQGSSTAAALRHPPQTFSRGQADFSTSRTRRPRSASIAAAAPPATPAPTTTASQ